MLKISALTFICLFLSLETMASSELADYDIKSNNLAFVFHSFQQKATHQETSSSPSFSKLDKETTSSLKSLSLAYSREFFAKKALSLTLSLARGKMIGGGSEVDQQGDVEYETDIQDTASTSIGISLNINFIYSTLKVQPFLSFSLHQNEFTMETKYTKISTQDVTILKYENEVKRNLISLGTRFFDPQTQLMSISSVSYLLSETQTNALTSATVNEAAVSLSNTGSNTFSSGDLSFSITAGYTF